MEQGHEPGSIRLGQIVKAQVSAFSGAAGRQPLMPIEGVSVYFRKVPISSAQCRGEAFVSILLSQTEADYLIALQKRVIDSSVQVFPQPGGKLVLELESLDRSEDFYVDVSRGRIDLSKITYQNRAREIVVLMRLDLGGPPHRNPDGEQMPCPHLHIYREAFGDKWAYPVPAAQFTQLGDLQQTLTDFLNACNVVEHPIFQAGLF